MSTCPDDKIMSLKGIKFVFENVLPPSEAIPLFYPISAQYRYDFYQTVVYTKQALHAGTVPIMCSFLLNSAAAYQHLQENENYGWVNIWAVFTDCGAERIAVKQTPVAFMNDILFSTKDMQHGFVPLQFDLKEIFAKKNHVCDVRVQLDWYWSLGKIYKPDNPRYSICTTFFDTALSLDIPSYPWTNVLSVYSTNHIRSFPWSTFFKWACLWASFRTEKKGAAFAMCQALWIGKLIFHFPPIGYNWTPSYTSVTENKQVAIPPGKDDGSGPIQYTYIPLQIQFGGIAFDEFLLEMYGKGDRANCTDFATIVMLFGNTLGCNLKVMRLIRSDGQPMEINPVFLLGRGKEMLKEQSMSYHDVAYLSDIDTDGTVYVYDPCFQFSELNALPACQFGLKLSDYKQYLFVPDQHIVEIPYSENCAYCMM